MRFFARLRPSISYSPDTNTWSGSIDTWRGANTDRTPPLMDAIDALARLAPDLKQPAALVIDEFQKIIELGGQTTEAQIRAAIQLHTELGFVLADSKTALLNDGVRDVFRVGATDDARGTPIYGPIPDAARGIVV